jgi:hypothetical protein
MGCPQEHMSGRGLMFFCAISGNNILSLSETKGDKNIENPPFLNFFHFF